jgi:hypothetical protein
LFAVVVFAMVVLRVLAAFWAAEKTEEKKPLGDWGGPAVPPGVLTSSSVGVNGADIEFDNLLGGFVAERARRCDIMFPEGETTTLGLDCELACFVADFELFVDSVGDTGFMSVGVGGVTSVVGASIRLGGVDGSWVMILLGA